MKFSEDLLIRYERSARSRISLQVKVINSHFGLFVLVGFHLIPVIPGEIAGFRVVTSAWSNSE